MKQDLPLLFDTHVWIWLAYGEPGRIKPRTMRAVEDAGSRRAIRISVVSVWEIALLESRGRLELPIPVAEWIRRALDRPDFELVGLEPEIAIESCNLPGEFHADPADRILVASARLKNAIIVTRDQRILKYGKQGHVKTMAA
ncbi:MAG: type II toxin-antitoxin system VapC family toxin [Betaproteobacteria bacterium]|nr:type II toxin-antitoxin system VapC family toxin [Betaproteobacteria bacterium]MBI2961346.1 type II toxin-antitoxin system VapC family toxin [Betaproteobacteria bacterium]